MTEPAWMAQARLHLGLKEKPGPQSNQTILQFYRDSGNAGASGDSIPWCAAFVGAMLKRSGVKGSGKLNARSYLDWGVKLTTPKPGAVTVFKRGNSSWQGHVAFFLREVGDKVEVLGGNQGDSVSIAKYPKANLLGYRWPKDAVVISPPDLEPVAPPAKPKNIAPAAGGAAVVATGVAVAAEANGFSGWLWIGVGVIGLVLGVAAYLYRDRIIEFINKLRG